MTSSCRVRCYVVVASVLRLLVSHSAEANNNSNNKEAALAWLPRAYKNWNDERGGEYEHFQLIGSRDETAAVNWKISGDEIRVAVAANATGWVSFGIAESGGMPGADIVTYTAKDDSVTDAHALAYAAPIVDKCQHWELLRSTVDDANDYIVFEASRKLDTGDPQDRVVGDDSDESTPPNRIIAAWGDTDEPYYHGTHRAAAVARLRRSSSSPSESKDDDVPVDLDSYPFVDMIANNFSIPLEETIYEGFCYNITTMAEEFGFPENKDVHLIGARFIEDSRAIEHVHHLIVYASREENECGRAFDMVYLWGPGAADAVLPSNAGFLLGPNGYKSFRLSIHYDNQNLVPDKYDSSGARLFYTETLREHEAGIFQIGDPFLLMGVVNGEGATSPKPDKYGKWEIDCPGSCTRKEIPRGETLTVFGEYLHMHEVGSRMVSSQYRWGRKIRESVVDYYDFYFNGAYGMIQKPYEIQRGDAFKVSCFYKSKTPGEIVPFGPGSNEEMCISFLWYYPRIEDSAQICSPLTAFFGDVECNAWATFHEVEECGVRRGFGREPASCDCKKSNRLQSLMDGITSLLW